MNASIQTVALTHLQLSATGAQTERRKRFDKAAIRELADSIKTIGVLQPLVVRALFHKDGGSNGFQIVAGERRFLAAQAAGLKDIAVNVRELTDEQVLEVQLIENLQREGLHELVEAEGYEALMKRHGHTVEDLVAKVGKSRGYVYARLKLLALGKEGRKAFFDGAISASIALLVARIPGEDLQRQALKEINGNSYNGPMSYRQAAEHVQRTYMLKLGSAGFPTRDVNLVPAAGACGACPKRTGNQPELFGDVKGADVCTDPSCFQAKRQAWAARQLEEARAKGQTVIEGAQAKKIAPHGVRNLAGGYVSLDDHCYEDSKNRTYRQILGKRAEPVLLQVPPNSHSDDADQVVEVVQKSAVAAALKAQGVKSRGGSDDYRSREKERDRQTKREQAYRIELVKRLQTARAKKRGEESLALSLGELRFVLEAFFHRLDGDAQSRIAKVWGVAPTKSKNGYGKEIELPIKHPNEAAALLLDCVYAMDLHVSSYSKSSPKRLLEACKRYGVNAEKVREELAAAEKVKTPAGKKSARARRSKSAP